MARSTAERDVTGTRGGALVDPRRGDIEDDAASPGQRSLLAIAGSLLVEISLPKLLFAWTVSLLLPALLLGVAPLVATAWFSSVSRRVRGTDGDRRDARAGGGHRGWMARMAATVSDRRDKFLVTQCACRPARLCVRPRGVAPSRGTDVRQGQQRGGTSTAACGDLGRRGHCAVPVWAWRSRSSFGRLRAGSVLCRIWCSCTA